MVSYIADVTWTIVDRKQTEERIRELNDGSNGWP
jgi:hypothetical protein